MRSDGRKWFARMGRFQVAPTQARSRASLDFLNRFAGKVNLPMVKIAEVSDIFMIGKHVLPCRYLTYFMVVFVHLIDDMVPSVDSAVQHCWSTFTRYAFLVYQCLSYIPFYWLHWRC